jgi:phosphatidylglycerol:prolipoprotein diacylglycerol transferase
VRPVLFSLPHVGDFPSYLVLLAVGFVVAIAFARREEDRVGGDGDRIADLGLLMVVSGIAGARALSVLADGHLTEFWRACVNPPHDCLAMFAFWNGGLAYYGGFLVAVPVGLWYARRRRLGVWRVADLTAPYIALGLFFGRIGCYLNGCCFGVDGHPTQLYEAAAALGIAALLYVVVRPRKRAHGQVFAGLLVLYGVARFALEFLRADDRGIYLGLSTSQWISIPLVAWGIFLGLRWSRPRAG